MPKYAWILAQNHKFWGLTKSPFRNNFAAEMNAEMKRIILLAFCSAVLSQSGVAIAQNNNMAESASDSVYQHIGGRRLTRGGAGDSD